MADPYDYFCKPDTPQDLKDALLGGNQDRLRSWCKQNPDRLSLALECIHPHHTVYREIVQQAFAARQRDEDTTTAERQHQQTLAEAHQANRLSRWAIGL